MTFEPYRNTSTTPGKRPVSGRAVLATLLLACQLMLAPIVMANAETSATTLMSDVQGQLDDLGRVPLSRLTFERTAGVGPEDLPTPFIAYVESGTFTYRDGAGEYTDVGAGEVVEVVAGDDYALRNIEPARSSLIVLMLPGSCAIMEGAACAPHFLPFEHICNFPCRPDVTNTLLFYRTSVMHRFADVTYSVGKVAVPNGESTDLTEILAAHGEGELMVRVDKGSVELSTGDQYPEGEEFVLKAGESIEGTEPGGSELIVLSYTVDD